MNDQCSECIAQTVGDGSAIGFVVKSRERHLEGRLTPEDPDLDEETLFSMWYCAVLQAPQSPPTLLPSSPTPTPPPKTLTWTGATSSLIWCPCALCMPISARRLWPASAMQQSSSAWGLLLWTLCCLPCDGCGMSTSCHMGKLPHHFVSHAYPHEASSALCVLWTSMQAHVYCACALWVSL